MVHLEATFTTAAIDEWTVDTAETDMEFWTTTVTDAGVGDNSFNFKVGYGAKRATVVGWNLFTPGAAPAAADGWHVMVDKPALTTGVLRVKTMNANATPALADPPNLSRISITLALETL